MNRANGLTIVHVVRQFSPAVGGLENFVEQLALHQLKAGYRIKVVTLDRIFGDPSNRELVTSENHFGIDVVRIPFVGSKRYPFAPRVLSAIRGAHLVHVHGVDFFSDFLAATAWLHRKPMVLTTHGGFFHTSFARKLKHVYFKSVTRVALTQFGAVIACSDQDLLTFSRVSDARLALIRNPVDISKFADLADSSSSGLIYFGRVAPNKEVPLLIKWFAGLYSSDAKWSLIIAGKPMGVSLNDLRSQASELGIADHLEIHDLPSDEELRVLISRSSIYCCASSYEGFGLAAIEAASAGLFPVLSDIPPFRQSLERLGFGMLVNFNEPATWSDSYEELADLQNKFRTVVTDEQVSQAVASFSWPSAIPAVTAIYERVLGLNKRQIRQVSVDVLDQASATQLILEGSSDQRPMMVTFCNAHTANLASKDERFRNSLADAIVLNDGVGVDIASKLLFGKPFPHNLNGTDFVPHVVAATATPLRLFLVGGSPGVAEAAANNLRSRNPNVEIAGVMHGYFEAGEEEERVVAMIKASGANLVLVAMGQPRQELWAQQHFARFAGPTICVGALFDFLAGRVPRAPAVVRTLKLEWAFRLLLEPKRLWRRYLVGNLEFLSRTVAQRLFGRRH